VGPRFHRVKLVNGKGQTAVRVDHADSGSAESFGSLVLPQIAIPIDTLAAS
jgi:hypothetical protein